MAITAQKSANNVTLRPGGLPNNININPNVRNQLPGEAKRRRFGLIPAAWLFLMALLLINSSSAQSQQDYFNATDADGDGKVSLAEFQQSLRYAFDRIDTNQNDVIDADEALVPRMRGMTRARQQRNIAAQFGRQDKNRNGWLSVAELTEPY